MGRDTCIIVVEIEGQSGTAMIGIVVDAVSEVLNIKGVEIEGLPAFGTKLNTDYILGVAKIKGSVKILLDVDRVLSGAEIEAHEKINGSEEKEKSTPKTVDTGYAIKHSRNKIRELWEKEKPKTVKQKSLLSVTARAHIVSRVMEIAESKNDIILYAEYSPIRKSFEEMPEVFMKLILFGFRFA